MCLTVEASTAAVSAGVADLERSAAELASRIPDSLAPLAQLAYNYRWSWTPGGHELFSAVDAARFELCHGNPVRLLQETSVGALARATSGNWNGPWFGGKIEGGHREGVQPGIPQPPRRDRYFPHVERVGDGADCR